MSLSIVIPAKNESSGIAGVVEHCRGLVPQADE